MMLSPGRSSVMPGTSRHAHASKVFHHNVLLAVAAFVGGGWEGMGAVGHFHGPEIFAGADVESSETAVVGAVEAN